MKYRLTEKIGSGGMAEVFRAVGEGPQGFERPFVVKRIHPRLSEEPDFVRMFVDEAKISARLIHPNIVQVFEFAYQDGGYYIVMEPVEGIDMGWFRRRRPERRHELLPPMFVAEVGRQACRGLDFAHTLTGPDGKPLGIVHRDVTPPNIMVAFNGTVKIVDFGIARAVQALRTSLTDAGMVKGKMSYLAPELLNGDTADARSDVFSLGAVLHELLCGRQLFAGETDLETLKLVKDMPIPAPSALNPGVKPALDGVVMRALERDPAARYQSAGEMGDDLEALVLRKSYSTRALAQKTRELVEHDEELVTGRPPPVPNTEGNAPLTVGEEDSSVVVEDGAVRQGAMARARGPIAPNRPGGLWRSVDRRKWRSLALALPALLAVAIGWAIARRPGPTAIAGPVSSSNETSSAIVHIALDSSPQGATVTTAALRNGQRLGETPLLLDLPRGLLATELRLTKPGFAPLTFKIIPQRDKDVLAKLEPTSPTAVPTPKRPAGAAIRRTSIALRPATPAATAGRWPPLATGDAHPAPAPKPNPRPTVKTASTPGSSKRTADVVDTRSTKAYR